MFNIQKYLISQNRCSDVYSDDKLELMYKEKLSYIYNSSVHFIFLAA